MFLQESASKEAVKNLVADGAKHVAVDYSNANSLKEAFSGVDVVVSTLNDTTNSNAQEFALLAAKQAGVKLFVPSEFGNPSLGFKELGILQSKALFHDKLAEVGLPYTLFFTGGFSDLIFLPYALLSGILL